MGGRGGVALALCAVLAGACARDEAPVEPESARAAQDLAEHPCVGSWSGVPVVFLRIELDGRYEAFLIPSGGSSFDCLDVAGNGISRGSWRAQGEGARLEVEREDDDLAMSLRGAKLERDGEGLALVLGEQRLNLHRGDP